MKIVAVWFSTVLCWSFFGTAVGEVPTVNSEESSSGKSNLVLSKVKFTV